MQKILSIRLSRLSAIIIVCFIILITFQVVSMGRIYTSVSFLNELISDGFMFMKESRRISRASDYLTDQARFFAVTGDKVYLDNYWREVNETKSRDIAVANLEKSGVPKSVLQIAENAKKTSDSLIGLEDESFNLVQKGDLASAQKIMYGPEYSQGKNAITGLLEDFEEAVLKYSIGQSGNALSVIGQVVIVSLVLFITFSVIFLVVLALVFKGLIGSLRLMRGLFDKIASGDLTIHAPDIKGKSELYDTFRSMNSFIKSISEILRKVISSSEELVSGNNELAATMDELSSTFQSQAGQISETVSSMDDIDGKVRLTVDSLDQTSKVVDDTVKNTNSGKAQLDSVKSNMQDIHAQTQRLSESIGKVSESSVQIGSIIAVINDIADQTNLLALNAAIEAARAGDSGRGFAVVADEVRKLSERTQKATSEIESLITALRRESENASEEMESASAKVSEGVASLDVTASAFNEIYSGVETVNNMNARLAEDVNKEYETIQKVYLSTQGISSGIDGSSHAVNEVAKTVSHLQEQVIGLKGMVLRFRVL